MKNICVKCEEKYINIDGLLQNVLVVNAAELLSQNNACAKCEVKIV